MIPYVRSIAASGFAVLAIDQAGHGASTGELDFDALRDDGLKSISYLSTRANVDNTSVAILGWSLGAHSLWRIASRLTPDSGLKACIVIGAGLVYVSNFS
mgnify:CR=1 FL=1